MVCVLMTESVSNPSQSSCIRHGYLLGYRTDFTEILECSSLNLPLLNACGTGRSSYTSDHDRSMLLIEKNSFNFHGQSTVTMDWFAFSFPITTLLTWLRLATTQISDLQIETPIARFYNSIECHSDTTSDKCKFDNTLSRTGPRDLRSLQ